MKAFFDTSVLVPVFSGAHPHHAASIARFIAFDPSTACCGAHGVAEVYASLTRLPGKERASGDQAALFIGEIRKRLSIVALHEEDYVNALEEAARMGIAGGNVYDALLARCAIKAKAEVIYTWNVKHFAQLGPEVAGRIRTP